MKFVDYLIGQDSLLKNVYEKLERLKCRSLIVVSESGKLVGSISEGDIRRGLLRGEVRHQVRFFMNVNPVSISKDRDLKLLNFEVENGPIAVVDETNAVIDVEYLSGRKINSHASILSEVNVIAPTRVSLAGGGTDVDYWFAGNSGRYGKVLSFAINRYARVSVVVRPDSQINWKSYNTGKQKLFDKNDVVELVDHVIRKFGELPGLDINIISDCPVGSGLGGSSSMVVAICKALALIKNVRLSNQALVELAYDIERVDFKQRGGWQDYYAAVYGGLLETKYSQSGVGLVKHDVSHEFAGLVAANFFIVRHGKERSSSEMHKSIETNLKARESASSNMFGLLDLADDAVEALSRSQFNRLGEILNSAWSLKKQMSDEITNPELDRIVAGLTRNGAGGVRLLGAGSSGYLVVYCEPKNQAELLQFCANESLAMERVGVDVEGARATTLC